MTKLCTLLAVGALAAMPSAAEAKTMAQPAHCMAELSVQTAPGKYFKTLYLTQNASITITDDRKDGGHPALNAYSKVLNDKWTKWLEGHANVSSINGNCYFDWPGTSREYDQHKKNLEAALSWGPNQAMKIIQFDFPPAN